VISLAPGRFTPTERASGTHWPGGWVGPRAGLDVRRETISPDTHNSDGNIRLSNVLFQVQIIFMRMI